MYLVSERVQEYSSTIILYFQLQNHEYFYSGVNIVLGLQAANPNSLNPQCNIKVSIVN